MNPKNELNLQKRILCYRGIILALPALIVAVLGVLQACGIHSGTMSGILLIGYFFCGTAALISAMHWLFASRIKMTPRKRLLWLLLMLLAYIPYMLLPLAILFLCFR